jgi:hypothetical protein
MAGAGIFPGEAVAGGHGDGVAAPAGGGAFRVADAGNGQRRILGRRGAGDQRLGIRLLGIRQVEIDRDQPVRRIGEAGMGVLRHHPRHGDGALGERREALRRGIGGGDDRLPLAEEDAEAEVEALGPLQLLDRAEPAGDMEGGVADEDGVGGVRPGAAGGGDEVLQGIGVGHPGLLKAGSAGVRSLAPAFPSRSWPGARPGHVSKCPGMT